MMAEEENRSSSQTAAEAEPIPETSTAKIGFGILAEYPVISILAFAIIGIICGYGLSTWTPEDPDAKSVTLQWLGLIGDLFIRLLTCFVLPLVFVTVTISVVDMLCVGKASTIGWRVIGFYIFTTLIASLVGILAAAIFQPLFHTEKISGTERFPEVKFACDTAGHYVTEASDGTLSCMDGSSSDSSTFMMEDVNGYFVVNSEGQPQDDVSLSDQIYHGVFMKLFTRNIFMALTEGNFAAVVIFAIIFGAALGIEMTNTAPQRERSMENLLNVLGDADKVFVKMLTWVIAFTPFAVWSLITAAVGGQNDLVTAFKNVGLMIASIVFGYITQFLLVYVGAQAFITKSNPLKYLRHIFPAQTMALACASSAATLPITMRCVESTGIIPEPVWRFILPLGATINMDGMAIYLVCACVWLAKLNGIPVDFGDYVLLAILATVGSAGAAPVPQSGLVLILTSYNTTFNTTGTPNGFEFIIATDWFIDRMSTCMNVTSDTVVCRMVSATAKMDDVRSSVVDSLTGSLKAAGLTASLAIEQEAELHKIDDKYHPQKPDSSVATPPDIE